MLSNPTSAPAPAPAAAIAPRDLHRWCSVPVDDLERHPQRRVRLRVVADPPAMGEAMAATLLDEVLRGQADDRAVRAIVPCGPTSWYAPFRRMVVERRVSLARLTVFHMDECLDWQGRELPAGHPYNFRSYMERHFYGGIPDDLAVPQERRFWLTPATVDAVRRAIDAAPIDLTLGGWGQDGHIAYNQARRHPYRAITLDELRAATIRVQENNHDTLIALAQRSFGAAWQLVPPMSVTLGVRECLAARRVRLFSDTGAWKQTALRVALFSPPTPEYPMTLLQEHPDAELCATRETADHPIARHPEWDFFGD